MGLLKITFDDARVTSKDDADYYHHLAGKKNGVLDGILGKCVPSVSNSNISFQSGYVQVYGRRVYVESGTRMAITLDGNAKGYVYIKYDLGNNAATLEKKESSNFPTLREDDLMNGGLIYEFPLAKYQKTASSLTLVDGWSAPKIRILEELITEAEGRVTTIANAAQSAANSAQTTATNALNKANSLKLKFTSSTKMFYDPTTYEEIPTVYFPNTICEDTDLLIFLFHNVDSEGLGIPTYYYGSLVINRWMLYGSHAYVPCKSPITTSNTIKFAKVSDDNYDGSIEVTVSGMGTDRPGGVTLMVYKVGS